MIATPKLLQGDTNTLNLFLQRVGSYTEDLIFAPSVQTVFHYTDLAGLKGILSDGDLWLTHSRFSNDDEEITHGFSVAEQAIQASRGGPLPDSYLDEVSRLLAAASVEGAYVCCFCLKGNLLSQWRGYGANGSGVSLEFSPTGFNQITGPDSPGAGLIRLWKVFYDGAKQRGIVSEALTFGTTQPGSEQDRARAAADAISFFIPTFKNQDFSEEQECRLIFTPAATCAVRPRFRVARGLLVPYFTVKDLTQANTANPPFSLPLMRVLIGPGPNKQMNATSVEALLTAGGYTGVTVDTSSTPYRA